MRIKKLSSLITDENTYIVYDENTKNGLVIDPGYSTDGILKSANENNIKINYIFITHCHYDHIEFMEELRQKTGAPLVSGDKASINITDPAINHSYSGLGYDISAKKSDIILDDGEKFDADGIIVKCVYTPGHTNCSVCYIIKNHIFSGDTLFLRSIGRSDLPTGNAEELEKSIKEKLYAFDDNMIVNPGHGDNTSIGYEKKFNLFIKG